MFRFNFACVIAGCLLASSPFLSSAAMAQAASPPPDNGPLTQVTNDPNFSFSSVERSAANSEGITTTEVNQNCANGCGPGSIPLQQNLNALVNVAEDLENNNTAPGAQSAAKRLATALRAAAPEEYSSQRSAGTEFASDQLSSVSNRLSALLAGAHGFSIAGMNLNRATGSAGQFADTTSLNSTTSNSKSASKSAMGGAAGSDTEIAASPWGGFLDGSYGWGNHGASDFEDAFKFNGYEVTLGADYRASNRFVVGGVMGYADQKLKFDPAASQTQGFLNAKGYSLSLYGMYEWDGPYLSGTLGWQKLKHSSSRRVQYQLIDSDGNPVGAAVDESETGLTHSAMWTSALDAGWSLHNGAFGYEPYARFEYRDLRVDGFSETSVDNIGGGVGGYGATVAARSIVSLAGIAGFKMQYTYTPSYGVLVPYLKGEYHYEFHDDPLDTQATYGALAGVPPTAGSAFDLSSDKPDRGYAAINAGASLVMKGGFQAFLQYQKVLGLAHVVSQSIAIGLRTEF